MVAFEIVAPGPFLRVGAVVEGCGKTWSEPACRFWIGVAASTADIPADAPAWVRKGAASLIERRGWYGVAMHPDGLKPLTEPAREMLQAFLRGDELALSAGTP